MKRIGQWLNDRWKKPEATGPTSKEPKVASNEKKNETTETEPTPVKYPYPKGAYFMYAYVVFASMCNYGILYILALYIKDILRFDENHSTAFIHAFIFLSFTTPLISSSLSDSFLGKFRTLIYCTVICLLGIVLLTVSALPMVPHRAIGFIALILFTAGGGAIRSVIVSHGGDQFKLPEQARQLAIFFAFFYLCLNLSACIALIVSPILREMSCLGVNSCYPLPFGLSSCFLFIALVVFLSGKRMYIIKQPDINIVLQVFKCISHAIAMRRKIKKTDKKNHWLDYASDKYDLQLITDIKSLLSVIIIFIPAPFFWALYEQQTSTWIYQGSRMNGSVGKYTILPEQMLAINPFIIVILIPFFEFAVYPLCNKIGILKTPLQKFGLGLVVTALSFATSAIVAYKIQISGNNNVHLLWQLPQFIMLAVADVLLNVQALNFAYTQAPIRLKAVVTALWLLTIALGNLIIVFISGVSFFSNMMHSLIFYSGLILLDFFIFLFLAIRYKYHYYVD